MSVRKTLNGAIAQCISPYNDSPALQRTLLRLRDVCSATGLSRSAIYRLVRDGRFPQPVRLTSQVSAFSSKEIQGWIDSRIAERDAAVAAITDAQLQQVAP